jgi:hypothetical protein
LFGAHKMVRGKKTLLPSRAELLRRGWSAQSAQHCLPRGYSRWPLSDGGCRQELAQGFEGNVRAVTVDPTDESVIYVGVEPIHLYRSEDSGNRWEELTGVQELPTEVKKNWSYPRPPHREHVRHIFVDPCDPEFLLVCLEHGGIIRSFDRGATWEDVSRGIDYLDIHHISAAPGRKNLYFVATARGFFKSNDPGDGWRRAEAGFTRDYFHDFVFLPGSPGAMLVATADKSPGYWDRPERPRARYFAAAIWRKAGNESASASGCPRT